MQPLHNNADLEERAARLAARLLASPQGAMDGVAELMRDCASVAAARPANSLLAMAGAALNDAPAKTCYWIAHALLADDSLRATDWFIRSIRRAHDEGDGVLVLQSVASAMVADLLGTQRHEEMPKVIEAYLNPSLSLDHNPTDPLLVLGRLCAAYAFRSVALSRTEIEDGVLQVQAGLQRAECWPTPSMRVAAATTLVDFAGAFIDLERARDVAVATSLIVVESGCIRLRALWWSERGWLYASDSHGPMFQRCLDELSRHAESLDDDSLRFAALRLRCAAALRSGSDKEAFALLPVFEGLGRLTEAEAREQTRLKAAVLIVCGRGQQALDITAAALRLANLRGQVQPSSPNVELEMEHAHALACTGALDAAAAQMRSLAAREYGDARERLLASACAYDWQRTGGTNEDALRLVLKLARLASAYRLLPRDRVTLARLCDAGLRRDIEPGFVRDLIARRRLAAPPFACERWPWPVRIETLGSFRLCIKGEPYQPEHKSQDKVLELLKLLVAAHLLRRGEAERSWLCDQLWPETDATRARKSLETTVARLRRLLEVDAAVVVGEGRVRLDSSLVWSDVGAFVAAAARIKQAEDDVRRRGSATAGDLRADMSGLLSLFNGPFLQGEPGTPWVLGARAQVSRLLRQSLLTLAQLDDEPSSGDLLLSIERAHVVDPASEEIAQMLMRHHLEHANHVEALRVYRRTRDTIQAELGAAPSHGTELLGRQIFQAVERDATAGKGMSH
jgi:DNA-binding SARP family transcriptional activator